MKGRGKDRKRVADSGKTGLGCWFGGKMVGSGEGGYAVAECAT